MAARALTSWNNRYNSPSSLHSIRAFSFPDTYSFICVTASSMILFWSLKYQYPTASIKKTMHRDRASTYIAACFTFKQIKRTESREKIMTDRTDREKNNLIFLFTSIFTLHLHVLIHSIPFVSHTSDGHDLLRLAGVIFNLCAESADINGKRVAVNVLFVTIPEFT